MEGRGAGGSLERACLEPRTHVARSSTSGAARREAEAEEAAKMQLAQAAARKVGWVWRGQFWVKGLMQHTRKVGWVWRGQFWVKGLMQHTRKVGWVWRGQFWV